MPNVFAPQIFFIVFREVLEAVIIVSVLLSFLKQSLGSPDQDPVIYRRLVRQVWLGSFAGVFVCLIIGGGFIGAFYGLGKNVWAQSEDLWEGIFYLIATIIITIMGLALLRINKTKEKWRVKIAQALVDKAKHHDAKSWLGAWGRRHALFILPFVTTMREGVEAVVFVGGVSLGLPASAFPLAVVTGILAGLLCGFFIYRGGNVMSIQLFLIASTSVLYLIAAGLFSKAIWSLQSHVFVSRVGSDVSEEGSGPGSYDILESVWHVNCCNPQIDHGWDIFQAVLGWQNSATYGSVLAYNVYWIGIMVAIACMLYEERHGDLPGKKQILATAAKIPGLKGWALKKQELSAEHKAEILRLGQAHLAGGVFHDSEVDSEGKTQD